MTSPEEIDEKKGTGELSKDDSTVNVDLDESKAQLLKNGGASGEHPFDDYSVKIVDGSPEVAFNGLGKDEVMKYANDPFWVRLRWILFIMFWVGWFAMILTAILIIVFAPRCPPRPDLKWYQTETVYQAYSKSFKDTNNDGYGDFDGVVSKMDYINDDLGASAIYLNAIFETSGTSDLAIMNHKAFNPQFGATEAQFQSWMKALRKKGTGKQVIVDLVPNQTSRNHTWFLKSAAGDAQYKDYYIWAGSDPNSPPNGLQNMANKSAWTYDSTRKQWYLSQFSSDLPELNLGNEDVQKEFEDIMKYWFNAGVSGFRVMNLEYLVEKSDVGDAGATDISDFDGTLAFLTKLREVADSFSDKPGRERLLFGTVQSADKNMTMSLYGTEDKKALHIVVPIMKEINNKCGASCVKSWIEDNISDGTDSWLGLQLSGDGVERVASRMASESLVKIALALQNFLPGTPFNYYGDEIAMKDNTKLSVPDSTRTPMQWSNQPNAGFCNASVTPWLPIPDGYKEDNVMMNMAHFVDHSVLEASEKMISLRGKESFQWGKTKICVLGDLLMFTRKAVRFPYYLVIINMGAQTTAPFPNIECVDTKDKGEVVYHSRGEKVGETLDLDTSVFMASNDIVIFGFTADD